MWHLSSLRIGVLVLAILLGSCSASEQKLSAFYVRTIHAMKDAPNLQLNIGDLPLSAGVAYLTETGLSVPVSRGDTTEIATIDLLSFTPNGDQISIDSVQDFTFTAGNEYTVTATGTMANPLLVVTSNPRRQKPVIGAYLEFVDASVDQGPLDVYVTEPGLDLAGATPFATVSLAQATGSLQLTQGKYQIRITESGSSTVIFDTGTVDFSADSEWQMTIVDNIHPSGSSLRLVSTAGGTSAVIDDLSATAIVRAINVDTTSGPLDVSVTQGAVVLASGLDYASYGNYVSVEHGDVNLVVTPAGDPATVLSDSVNSLLSSGDYSLLIQDNGDGTIGAGLLTDDRRPIGIAARIRFIYAINDTQVVNVYLSKEAPTTVPPASTDAVTVNLQYALRGPLANVEPGEYYLTVVARPTTSTGGETVLLGPQLVQLSGGDVNTVLISQTSVGDPTPILHFVDDTLN